MQEHKRIGPYRLVEALGTGGMGTVFKAYDDRLNRRHLLEVRSLLREIAELRGVPSVDWNRPCRDQLPALMP